MELSANVVHWPPVCIGDTCRTYVNVTFVALVVRAILVIVTILLRLLSLSQERKIMYTVMIIFLYFHLLSTLE